MILQWEPLNVITLDHTESDNISRMLTITGCFYLVNATLKYGHIKRMITLTSDNIKLLSLYLIRHGLIKLNKIYRILQNNEIYFDKISKWISSCYLLFRCILKLFLKQFFANFGLKFFRPGNPDTNTSTFFSVSLSLCQSIVRLGTTITVLQSASWILTAGLLLWFRK